MNITTISAAPAAEAAASGNVTIPWEADDGTCGGGGGGNKSATTDVAASAAAPLPEVAQPLRLIGPYSCLVALQVVVSAGLLVLAVRRCHPASLEGHLQVQAPANPAAAVAEMSPRARSLTPLHQRLLIALTVLFYFSAVGGENIFWSLVSAYGSCSPALRLDARGAAALHAAFFVGFLAGRGLGVAVSHWARPLVIMLTHLGGCILSLLTLCMAATPWLTYAGTAAFGLCVSVLYATGVTWLEQRMDVAGPVACSWLIGGQLGISVLPALAGHLLVSPWAGPASVMQLALGAFAAAACAFLLMLLVTARRLRWLRKRP